MKSEKFIVTGGAGFIGCNVALELNKRGHEDLLIVDDLNHPGKEENLRALRYREYLDKKDFRAALLEGNVAPCTTLFHLGACSSTTVTDADYVMDNNMAYTRDLCRWCLDHDVRFIYASSAATYGDGNLGYSDSEDVIPRLKPLNLYGQSKQDFDLWALENGLFDQIVGLKYFNVFGPREDHKGAMRSVVNKAFSEIRDTGKMRLFRSNRPDYADGEQDRDFIYVKDAVAETFYFHDNPKVSGIYNCGTGHARTWKALAAAVFAALQQPVNIEMIDMPEAIRDKYQYHTEADLTKLRAAGFDRPVTQLEDAVAEYIGYLESRATPPRQ